MHVGDNIRRLRKARRLSQGAVAAMGGFDRPYISRVETGKQTPSLKFLSRLAEILDLPMAEFFMYPVTAVSDEWLDKHGRERMYIDLPTLELATLGAQRERQVRPRMKTYSSLVGRVRLNDKITEFSAPSPDVFAVRVPDSAAAPEVCAGDVLVVDPTATLAHGDLAVIEPTPGAPAEVRMVHLTGETPVFVSYDRVSSPLSDPAHVWGRVIQKIRDYPTTHSSAA